MRHDTSHLLYCYRSEASNKGYQGPSDLCTPIHIPTELSTRLEPLIRKPLTQHKRQ